ncbi:LysR family transcriptional regulator [Gordonia sp. NB41Y]|uniref:LysR family transcriptional regulator n=1 Tax=Gordonia sp. NB41Y TaxID=875808 RepID=UPI0006B22914|nr:LysR family transcriptional regulator [Gordonia sp. NB41Y]KOY48928.1 LysR family transcriptional regulator [Gordonia sp. NB41Y]WLP89520.1 LysR family transcriptional regulator [Gordonia sp. NB41Y]
MDLHLTAYFVAVIDHGGITKAAQALYISQPSLSQAIRTLEKRLGVTLFDRSGRRLELTDAGRRLEVAARRILADVDRAKDRVARVRELRSGRVDIVTNSTLAIDPLVGMVRAFRQQFADVVVRVVSADGPAGILAALRHGEAELGLIDSDADHASFVALPLGTQEMVLATDPALLPDRSTTILPRAAVRAIPLVVDHSDQPTAAMIADLVAEDARNVVVDCAHPAATWELVSRGVGATVLPRPIAAETLPHATIVELDPPLRRDYGLVTRSGQPSPAAAAFIAVARAHCGAPDVSALDGRDW